MLTPLTAVCLAAAAHAYQIPEKVLYAILAVEAGRVGEAVPNPNGTHDLGPFQINTAWGQAVARYLAAPVEQALERVRDDGCANAIVAAAILKGCASETRGDLMAAVGLYHSHSDRLAKQYQAKALSALRALGASSQVMGR